MHNILLILLPNGKQKKSKDPKALAPQDDLTVLPTKVIERHLCSS